MNHFHLIPSAKAVPFSDKTTDELYDLGLEIVPTPEASEDFPMPWDARFTVNDGKLIIQGGAGCSGYGSAEVTIPVGDVGKVVQIAFSGTLSDDAQDNLKACGWKISPAS